MPARTRRRLGTGDLPALAAVATLVSTGAVLLSRTNGPWTPPLVVACAMTGGMILRNRWVLRAEAGPTLLLVPGPSRDDVVRTVEHLLDTYAREIGSACVDAYSDHEAELPPAAAAAQERLRTLGARQGSGDPGMAVNLSTDRGGELHLLRPYAPWSIHVEVLDAWGRPLITLDDGGSSVVLHRHHGDLEPLRRALRGVATVEVVR